MTYIIKRKLRSALGDKVNSSDMANLLQHTQANPIVPSTFQDSLTLNNLVVKRTNRIPYGTDKYPNEEAIRGQVQYDTAQILQAADAHRAGQRLTISNRVVIKLGFWLRKFGTPDGSYYFAIRKVSDDSIIVREAVDLADNLTTTITYKEHTFASPAVANEEVRIMVEYGGDGAGDAANLITTYRQNNDVRTGEDATYYQSSAYTDRTAQSDHAYQYTSIPHSAGYIWMGGSNFHGFDENSVEQTYIHTNDVDDTPVDGATTDPISSNWAFDNAVLINDNKILALLALRK